MLIRKIMFMLYLFLPLRALSRLTGIVARLRPPRRIMRWAVGLFVRWYRVDMGIAATPEDGFRSFNEFFTRRLRPGARPVDRGGNAVVSPVDGLVQAAGHIEGDAMIQAKGISYSLHELVPSASSHDYANGDYCTIYLAPGDYHRIHSPVDGIITGYLHVPGRLLSVRGPLAARVPGLYAGNERVITFISTPRGPAAVCMVGAANVGSIGLSYDCRAASSFTRKRAETAFPATARRTVRRGDELGVFNLGSTVILLFGKAMVRFPIDMTDTRVQMGRRIARYA